MKVFLSHASEDKKLVEQIHLRIASKFPTIESWLDKYEIFGGDDLIDKIYTGIKDADKFLIFLSPNSIDKPWVRTELKKALADEISGIKPEFIIPIKIGTIPSFPPFLESRFYIQDALKSRVTRPPHDGHPCRNRTYTVMDLSYEAHGIAKAAAHKMVVTCAETTPLA